LDETIDTIGGDKRKEWLFDLDFSETDTDDEVSRKIDLALSVAKKLHIKKVKEWDEGEKLFIGEHEKLSLNAGELAYKTKELYKSDTILNRVFSSVRNAAGLMTDQRPQPTALPAPSDNEEDFKSRVERAKTSEKALMAKWEERGVSAKLPESCIQQQIFADAFFHPFWNFYDDDVDVEVVAPHNLLIEPHATCIEDADWVIKRTVRTPAWIRRHFGLSKSELKIEDLTPATDIKSDDRGGGQENSCTVSELWTDEFYAVKAGKRLLKKGKNPFFEFRSVQEQQAEYMQQTGAQFGSAPDAEQMAAMQQAFVPITNFFDRPKKPFIQLKSVHDGRSFYSKSVMKQLKPVALTINQRKQQIDDNANNMANLKLLYDSALLTEEEADSITNRPGGLIGMPGLAQNPGAIRFEGAPPLPQYVVDDMMHSERVFDDIIGLHDITRGAKAVGRQTATQANILREADQTVVRLFVRGLETATCDIYKWWLQLMKLFYTEDKWIKIVGSDDTYEYFQFSSKDIDDGLDIQVKPGSTLPTNKDTMRDEALQLRQMNAISLVDLYEALEKPNPAKMAQNLMMEMQGQVAGAPAPVGQDPEQENQMMMQGQMVEPKPEDDHQGHIQVHTAVLKQAGQQMPPEIAQLIEKHISMHQEMMQQTQGGPGGQPAMMGGQGAVS